MLPIYVDADTSREELILPRLPAPPEAVSPNRPAAGRPATSDAAELGGSQGRAGA